MRLLKQHQTGDELDTMCRQVVPICRSQRRYQINGNDYHNADTTTSADVIVAGDDAFRRDLEENFDGIFYERKGLYGKKQQRITKRLMKMK